MTWETGARFANWLTNGRGAGDTETGAYTFNGGSAATPDHAKLAVGEKTVWVLPNENEWYKAAYFNPDASGYSLYANGSDDLASRDCTAHFQFV